MNGSSYSKHAFENEITLLNQLFSDLESKKGDIEGHVQWLQCRGKKRKRCVDVWLNDLEKLRERAGNMIDFVLACPDKIYKCETQVLIREAKDHKKKMPMVLSTEFVGKNFEESIRKMWKLLSDDQVFIIGICGMGGVGKTSLATYVESQIKRKGTFKDVFWVTVSQNSSISKLQHDIAKRIGVKLDEDDERVRAANLLLALETKEKSILILDDVWKYIDFEKVGIPNGIIKVIVTSRLKHVCQQMDCLPNNMIHVLPLEYDVANELFMEKLGHNGTPATLPPEVENIARSIVMRLGGLPLGISVVARTMKGLLGDIHRWKYVLNKIEKMEMGEEVEEVFKVLKHSYDNLLEKDLQNCFLYCALLPDLERDEVIMMLVANRLIKKKSLQEIFDEGETILDKLEAHSLLMKSANYVRVHRLVTAMACHVLKEGQRCVMVKFEKGLTKEWTTDLELVHLKFVKSPEGTSPRCPRLSTLILGGYYCVAGHSIYIPDCFFQNMNALKILHLSYDYGPESLPSSLSDLRFLVSLVLIQCESLKYVPPLGKLLALSRLVISECSIEKVPEGLEKLIHLQWLDLSFNWNLTLESGSVLPKLTNLQYLDLRYCPDLKIKVEDVQGMKMLECFGGTFLDGKHYKHYVQNILDKHLGPKTYRINLGNNCNEILRREGILPNDPKTKTVCFGDCRDLTDYHILPKDIRDLFIVGNEQWVCLCDAGLSNVSSTLRSITINDCDQMKSVFCSSGPCFFCTNNFQSLEDLALDSLQCLTIICKEEVADVRRSFSTSAMFPCLKDLYISFCNLIEKLLTPRLVLQLPKLERITVKYCNSMQEIFAVGSGDNDDDSSSIVLPKLTTLKLEGLPKLKTVSKCSDLQLPNLERITVEYCNSMEEIFVVGKGGGNDGSDIKLPNLERITVKRCSSVEELFVVGNRGDNVGSEIMLPKLTRLKLEGLPKLKTMCKGSISFGPSSTFLIDECQNLDRNYPTTPFQLDDSGELSSSD